MTLEQAATPLFANHQTFHPRFGWVKKGHDAALTNPNVFNEQFSPVLLGVGKNMVEAIRFWTASTRVIVRLPHPERPRQSIYVPTKFGQAIFDEDFGLDPYSEDPTTLWMLHWQAVSATSMLPIWRSAFNDFSAVEFNEDDLLQFCADEVASTTWSQPKRTSIAKDVDCLLRMYTRRETKGRQTLDDLLDSPFRELGIVTPSPGVKGSYRFALGEKAGLTASAIVYACLDFMSRDSKRTASTTRLAVDPGSPGRLLKITEREIVTAIEDVSTRVGGLTIARPAGANQLVTEQHPSMIALAVMWAHHSSRRSDQVNVEDIDIAGPAARTPALNEQEIAKLLRRAERSSNKKGSAA
ncbi:MAG: DUF4007 domain-containing protein [Gordonia sp.]|nr:DUF4007 domain-containing protein [Gordonia sp. (in: high G+C Gram-positive bacteria)]